MKNFAPFNLKKAWLLIVICSFSLNVFAQLADPNPQDKFWDNVRFGGNIGLSFGSNFFSGTLSPSAIYQLNHQVALGTAIGFTYNEQRDFYKSTVIGLSFITLYNPIPEIQLSGEFEQLHVNRKYENALDLPNNEYWYPALYLGAGYGAGNVTIGMRFDVLYDSNKSIYANSWAPFIRVYF
ncbi:MAG: alpha-ketoglutarate decarboxylase [Flavobacteriaceae bacterium]|nr:alpha-ketoglutarate decarboxylase [Flavobacteriaceae bacterium]